LKNIIFMNENRERFHGHNDLVVKGLSATVNLPIISADDICADVNTVRSVNVT
jgi:hypothetical protein